MCFIATVSAPSPVGLTAEQIWQRIDDGLPKLWVIHRTLRLRHVSAALTLFVTSFYAARGSYAGTAFKYRVPVSSCYSLSARLLDSISRTLNASANARASSGGTAFPNGRCVSSHGSEATVPAEYPSCSLCSWATCSRSTPYSIASEAHRARQGTLDTPPVLGACESRILEHRFFMPARKSRLHPRWRLVRCARGPTPWRPDS